MRLTSLLFYQTMPSLHRSQARFERNLKYGYTHGMCSTRKSHIPTDQNPSSGGKARERILAAAYELFSRNGIRATGIDAIISASGVARMTLYRHFRTKDDLVLAFLKQREQKWTEDWLVKEISQRGSQPGEKLLAIFDVFDKWFKTESFEGCSFINVMLETPERTSPVHQASVHHLSVIRGYLKELALSSGVTDADDLARKWHVLMKGSIIAAAEGDSEAARRAQEIGALLLQHAQSVTTTS